MKFMHENSLSNFFKKDERKKSSLKEEISLRINNKICAFWGAQILIINGFSFFFYF